MSTQKKARIPTHTNCAINSGIKPGNSIQSKSATKHTKQNSGNTVHNKKILEQHKRDEKKHIDSGNFDTSSESSSDEEESSSDQSSGEEELKAPSTISPTQINTNNILEHNPKGIAERDILSTQDDKNEESLEEKKTIVRNVLSQKEKTPEQIVAENKEHRYEIPKSGIVTKDKIIFRFNSQDNAFLHPNYIADIYIDGTRYWHIQGYYQSRRFTDMNEKITRHISTIQNPILARQRATDGKYIMTQARKDKWYDGIRDGIMKRATLAKFATISKLYPMLVETKDKVLICDDPNEEYWGIGKNRTGNNMLGKILMDTREMLNKFMAS